MLVTCFPAGAVSAVSPEEEIVDVIQTEPESTPQETPETSPETKETEPVDIPEDTDIAEAVTAPAEPSAPIENPKATKAAPTSGTVGQCTWTFTGSRLIISGDGDMGDRGGFYIPWKNLTGSIYSAVIEEGVTGIGSNTFSGCSNLAYVTIPDSVTRIGDWAFNGCKSLTSITIPDSVTSIGEYAFYDCSSLSGITVGTGVKSIGKEAFTRTTMRQKVRITDIQSWCAIDFGNTNSNPLTYLGELYLNGTLVTEINLPEGTEKIGSFALYCCKSLTKITIPDSVTSVGRNALAGCSNLAYTIYEGGKYLGNSNNPYMVLTSLENSSSITSIQIHPNTKIIGTTFKSCSNLTSITIPNKVISIGDYVFEDCSNLASITIGDGVTSIGRYAFYNCSGLTDITIPDRVTSIGEYAFWGCTGLTNVTMGNSVDHIGSYAFHQCSNLTGITIPDGVTTINEGVFGVCTGLASITFANSVTSIGSFAFLQCTSLTDITIPDSVTSIEEAAFLACSGLISVTIGDNVTSIGEQAFKDCESLNSVIIGDSVSSIGAEAFCDCSSLTGVVIPDSVTSIGNKAFSGCGGLTSITIPFVGESRKTASDTYQYPLGYIFGTTSYTGADVVTQKYYGFSTSSTSSTTYYIPTTLKTVTVNGGNLLYGAFYNCTKLTTITIGKDVLSVNKDAFIGCNGLERIEVDEDNPNYCSESGILYNKDKTQIIWAPANQKLKLQVNYYYINGEKAADSFTDLFKAGEKYSIEAPEIPGYSASYDVITGTMPAEDLTIDVIYYENAKQSSGQCNDSISWTLYEDGSLILRGSGDMPDYVSGGAPWAADADQVTAVYLDSRITSVGDYAFQNCSSAIFVDYGYSVTSVGKYAFSGCTSITALPLPKTVKTIEEGAFYGCSSISNVVLPNAVTTIGAKAFQGCSSIEKVTVGTETVQIGEHAFADCTGLTQAYFRGAPAELGADALGSTDGKYVYYYTTVSGWSEAVTDGLWYGYTAVPYDMISENGFDGTNFFIVKVVDRYNEIVENAKVVFGNQTMHTTKDGMAYFVYGASAQKLVVDASALGFVPFTDESYTVANGGYMEIIALSDHPSTVAGVSFDGESIATSTVQFNCNEDQQVKIVVSGYCPRTIIRYELLQGNRILSTVKTDAQTATFTVNAKDFEEGETVQVRMYISDGSYVVTALNVQVLHIAKFSEEEFLSGMKNVNINLPVVGNIPFKFVINNPAFTNVVVEDDTIKLGINMDLTDPKDFTSIQKAIDEAKKAAAKKVLKDTSGFEAELSGYVEIKYLGNNRYEIVKSQVSLAVGARLSVKGQASWFGIVGVYFKVSLTSTGELTLVFADYDMDEGFKFEDLNLEVKNTLRLEGGAYLLWGIGRAGLYGQGTLGFELGIAPDFEVDHVYLKAEAGVSWSVFWGAIKGEKAFWNGVVYEEWPSKKSLRGIGIDEELQAALLNPENYSVNDRAYLSERSDWLGGFVPAKKNSATDVGTLQSNVYYNIAPKIVSCGDTVMMVWLDDNSNRSNGNYQTLYYALFDQKNKCWSAPVQVDRNETFDCEFDVCTDGKNIYILYTEKTALQADMEDVDVSDSQQIAEIIANVDIKVCVFDGSGFRLSAVLTDNDECETLPSLQYTNGVLTATWATMEAIGIGQASSGMNNIFCAQLVDGVWSKGKKQVGNAQQVYALSSGTLEGKNYTAYIMDADGSSETIDDYVLLIVDEHGNRKQLDTGEIGAVQFVAAGDMELLMWSDHRNIYYVASDSDMPGSLLTDRVASNGTFTCTALENGNVLISFVGTADNVDGTDIFGICFNGETVEGEPFRITKAAGYIDSYDVEQVEDGFVVSYIETAAQVNGETINTTADFKYAVLRDDAHIDIADVEYDICEITAGSTFSATLHLNNGAMVSANGVTVELRSGSGELISAAFHGGKILPGATREITVQLTAPQIITPDECILVVKAAGENGDGSSFNLPVGYANLGITGEQKIIGGKNFILFTATNSGNVGAVAAVSLCENAEEIATTAGLYVEAGDTAIYMFDASGIAENNLVNATIHTDVYEPYKLDNTVSVNLLHIDHRVYLYTPSEMVESPGLSITSAKYDKYTDESICITIEVGADSFAGIQGLKKGTDYTVSGSKVTISKKYLQQLPEGTGTLIFNFDYQQEQMVTRSLTVTVSDSTPVTVTGQVTIDGDGTVGSTITADISGLRPYGAAYDYVWSIDGKEVCSEYSYTVAVDDFGKTITLAVTAKNGYTGTFTTAVVADLKTQNAPVAPVVAQITDTAIELIALEGVEYSIDLQQWQSEGQFCGLMPNTQYTFYARMKATKTAYASPASAGVKITTAKTMPVQPAAPQAESITYNSITLVADPAMEYCIEGGSWTNHNVFTGLEPDTAYVFYQRYRETDTAYASEASTASFKTQDRTPIEGTVTIEGKPYCGSKLNAVLKNFTGETESVIYRWCRDGVAIDGAVHSTYTVTRDDLGKTLELRVSGVGAYQGELTAQLEIPMYIRGDVNGDGYVTNKDAIYLLRHTLMPGRYPINQSGDMNGDSYVTNKDAIYLLRHTLMPGRYPLYN